MFRIVILLILVNCLAIGYCYEFTLTKDKNSYTIVHYQSLQAISKYSFGNEIPDSTNSMAIDSVIVVPDRGDTIFVFIAHENGAFYCLKQGGRYKSLFEQSLPYEFLWEFHSLDINKDGNLDFVAFQGDDEGNASYTVLSYDKQNKDIIGLYFSDYCGVCTESEQPIIEQSAKIKNNKLYIVYGYFPLNYFPPGTFMNQVVKYGVLDYTRDKTREIYFRPISVTTPEKWAKF